MVLFVELFQSGNQDHVPHGNKVEKRGHEEEQDDGIFAQKGDAVVRRAGGDWKKVFGGKKSIDWSQISIDRAQGGRDDETYLISRSISEANEPIWF